MKLITQWDPFKDLDEFQERLSGMFKRNPLRLASGEGDGSTALEVWRPLVDIAEDEKEFVITAELPQVKKEDIKVSVNEGVLTISGERKMEKEEKGKKYHRVERAHGSFSRSFSLSDNVKADLVKADFKDGILKVCLPKSEEKKSKEIEVKIS